MPKFEITSPDGRRFEVTAPEGASQQEVLDYFRKQTAGVQSDASPEPKYKAGIGDMLYHGATLGFGDEIDAAAMATGDYLTGKTKNWGEAYNRELGDVRQAYENYTKENPVLGIGSEVAGGMLVPLGGAKKAYEGAKGFWQTLGRGATEGAKYGAVAGAGYSEGGAGKRALGALEGGLLGGALGGALPAAFMGTKGALNALGGLAGVGTNEGRAAQIIARELERASLTPDEAIGRVQVANERGAPLAPADLSPGLTDLAGTLRSRPGVAANKLDTFFRERQLGQGERTLAQLRRHTGTDADFAATADDIVAARQREAAPLYEQAYAGDAASPELDALLPRLEASGALRNAGKISEISGESMGAPPSMKAWDLIKRGLDDEIEGYRDKVTGRLVLDDRGRALVGLRSQLVDALDAANPAYREARKIYAGHSELLDALHLGRAFMRGDEEMVAARFGRLSATEQQMFRVGAVRELRRIIEGSNDGINVVRKIFGSPDKRNRLRMLFADDQAFEDFSQIMSWEGEMSRTNTAVTGNSRTAQRMAGQDELLADTIEDIALTGRPTSMIRRAWTAMLFRARGIDEATSNILADFLTSGKIPKDQVPMIIERIRRDRIFRERLVALAKAGGLTGALMGAQKEPEPKSTFNQWMTRRPEVTVEDLPR